MSSENKKRLNLYQPAPYEIIVPGHLNESWVDWARNMNIVVGNDADGLPITTLRLQVGLLDSGEVVWIYRSLLQPHALIDNS